jgi:quercetin dioxygenase-like cupin family protein
MKPFILNLNENTINQRTPILTVENSKKMKSGIVVLHSSEEVGEHNTNEREELIIVLEGNATLEVEGSDFFEVKSGFVAYIPSRTMHNVKNKSDFKLRYLYVVAQAE